MTILEPVFDVDDLRRALLLERYGPVSLTELERERPPSPVQLERRKVLLGESEPVEDES